MINDQLREWFANRRLVYVDPRGTFWWHTDDGRFELAIVEFLVYPFLVISFQGTEAFPGKLIISIGVSNLDPVRISS